MLETVTIPKKNDGMRKIHGRYLYFWGAYSKNITMQRVRTVSRTPLMDQKLYVNCRITELWNTTLNVLCCKWLFINSKKKQTTTKKQTHKTQQTNDLTKNDLKKTRILPPIYDTSMYNIVDGFHHRNKTYV